MDLQPHIEKFSRRFAEVESALSDPKVFDHNQRAQELSRMSMPTLRRAVKPLPISDAQADRD